MSGLRGRAYRPRRIDPLTRPLAQRLEDRVRGKRSGRAEGEGETLTTDTGEQPAHTTIDAYRDRAVAEVAEAFEPARANAQAAWDEAIAVKAEADAEVLRLGELRADKQAALEEWEARHAA